jgi:hypothetical protein
MACLVVSKAVAAVWVLTAALAAILEAVAVAGIDVGVCDVVMAVGVWGVMVGSLCIMGLSREGLGDADGCRDCCLSWWCRQDSSVKHTTHSDEHVFLSSHNSVVWAVDHCHGLSTAWVAFSKMVVAVCVLAVAQVVVLRPFVSGVVAIVGGDVMVATGGSGYKEWGWEWGWGAVGRVGSVWHCF